MSPITYRITPDANAIPTLHITGARIAEARDAIAIWCLSSDCLIPFALWNARTISLMHALWEADSLCEWTSAVAALSTEDRALMIRIGAIM